MRIELENIGMLKQASVDVDGLTVIAGENDTGKSTIGKIVFCIIKAISRYEEDFKESKEFKIEEILNRMFFHIRRNIKVDSEKEAHKIAHLLDIDYYLAQKQNEDLEVYLDDLKNLINDISENRFLKDLIKRLESIMFVPDDKQKLIENALYKVFNSEFNSNILNYDCEVGSIKLFENNLELLNISVDKDNKIKLQNKVEPIEIKEATFIETPLILNNHDMLIRSQSGLDLTKKRSILLGVPYTTLHTKDLFEKLKLPNISFFYENDEFEKQVNTELSSIINGEIIYDEDEKDFVYMKDGKKIPIKNTATGIKAFGIIQLLINSGFINRTSILILDEPDIHLHPKWQLQYAQIIAILVKYEIQIIVTSHSPYMIQSFIKYSQDYKISEKSNFYLIDKEDEMSVSKNVNNSVNEIFELLAQPMNEIY
ncbi:MAG: AAA family ATPase [Campylobacterales bacterium]|nr:AAA family ATPase [Campylobacterales bacterium]